VSSMHVSVRPLDTVCCWFIAYASNYRRNCPVGASSACPRDGDGTAEFCLAFFC
jgi:hypothetical protein